MGNDESENSNFKSDKMKCIYDYTINGISYKKTINFYSNGLVAVKYPYEIMVYYDKKILKGLLLIMITILGVRDVYCLLYCHYLLWQLYWEY